MATPLTAKNTKEKTEAPVQSKAYRPRKSGLRTYLRKTASYLLLTLNSL